MKKSHLLVSAGCLVAVSYSLYVIFIHQDRTLTAVAPAGVLASHPQADDRRGGSLVGSSAFQRTIHHTQEKLHARFDKDVDADNRLKKLTVQLERLQQQLAELDKRVQWNVKAEEAAKEDHNNPVDSSSLTEVDLELITQDRERQDRQQETVTETHFQAEPVDTERSSVSTGLIEQVLVDGNLRNTDVLGVDCRTTACRLEVQHADADAASQFAVGFSTQVADGLPQISFYQQQLETGRIGTVFYLTREGYKPLDVDN